MLTQIAGNVEGLTSRLTEVNWKGREERYCSVFEKVKFNHIIKKPSASVIVISWRFVEGLKKNIELLLAQRGEKNYEIIFVNNGKDDNEFSSIWFEVDTYISLSDNTGAYVARNIGSLFAKAPVFIFLEDDGIIGDDFVKNHLEAFDKYNAISVRGVCEPLTNNPLNKLARHYNLGRRPYAAAANLEGNSSFKANAFRKVGGWNDEINFGHGGPELSYRLTKTYPDRTLQIYYPKPVIFHDYAQSAEHLKNKKEKQQSSYQMLISKYPDWQVFMDGWKAFDKKSYLLQLKKNNLLERLYNSWDYLIYGVIRHIYRKLR
jgi:glycosyltransferase involved in cell wall biosynthesis